MNAERQSAIIAALSEALPTLRKQLHLTQADLGTAIGMTGKTIYFIEAGRQRMTWSMCLALLYLFSLDHRAQTILNPAIVRDDELAALLKNPKWE